MITTKRFCVVAVIGAICLASSLPGINAYAAEVPVAAPPYASTEAVNSMVAAEPNQFGGIYLDSSSNTLHVNVAPGIYSTTLSDVQGRTVGTGGMRIVVARVPRSTADLNRLMDEVPKDQPWAAQVKNILASWAIDPRTDKVDIGVTKLSPQVKLAAQHTFGSAVELHQEERAQSMERVTVVPGIPKVRHLVAGTKNSEVAGNVLPAISGPPLIDFQPYIDGDRMFREIPVPDEDETIIVQCTAGLTWNNGGTELFMASAGHCGPVNTSWAQGYFDQTANELFETGPMGTPFVNPFGQSQLDGMLMDNDGEYETLMWHNINGAPYAITDVTFRHDAVMGDKVCFNGSFTGTKCSGVVQNPNGCDNINNLDPVTGVTSVINVCGLTKVTSTERIVQSGDSGGPVFFGNPANGSVGAVGIISAGTANGLTGFYSNGPGFRSFFSGNWDITSE